jgi:hypothetical protein
MPMDCIKFGRRIYSFNNGDVVLKSTSVTEKALPDEDETAFTDRLVTKYGNQQGVLEIVFKRGRPDYAIITFC